jgi:hypothetical protein
VEKVLVALVGPIALAMKTTTIGIASAGSARLASPKALTPANPATATAQTSAAARILR